MQIHGGIKTTAIILGKINLNTVVDPYNINVTNEKLNHAKIWLVTNATWFIRRKVEVFLLLLRCIKLLNIKHLSIFSFQTILTIFKFLITNIDKDNK